MVFKSFSKKIFDILEKLRHLYVFRKFTHFVIFCRKPLHVKNSVVDNFEIFIVQPAYVSEKRILPYFSDEFLDKIKLDHQPKKTTEDFFFINRRKVVFLLFQKKLILPPLGHLP